MNNGKNVTGTLRYIFLFILIIAHARLDTPINQNVLVDLEYKGCFGQITIWLHDVGGSCHDPVACIQLQQCSVLYGNLIFKSTLNPVEDNQKLVKPIFPKLREITGFLVIAFYNFELFDLLPSLSVLRGNDLVGNYALIVYVNEVKGIYFPSLTTILHGGVRIDRNNKLCYADGVRWKSIVKDVFQTEKFGIVIKSNNLNCDKSCVKGHCYAGAGHGNNPTAQFCWGPGINESDYQCQRFCGVQCSLRGCIDGTISLCCHSQCLGGCRSGDSPFSCHACKYYRLESTGQCVERCPIGYVLNDNAYCSKFCKNPYHLTLNGKCVKDCPAGYVKIVSSKTCVKCSDDRTCQRVCTLLERIDDRYYKGAVIRVPSDIKTKGLVGCTTLNGNLWIQLTEGTGDVDEFIKELQSVKIILGHIRVQQSSLKTLNFFENLELIDPPKGQLIHGSYAISVYENSHLEKLWKASQQVKVTNGDLFFQANPHLCPQEIYKMQNMMRNSRNQNLSGDISKISNGNRVTCEIEQLLLKVSEVKPSSHYALFLKSNFPANCILHKCVHVEWNFTRVQSSYNIIFFKIYYRQLLRNETADKQVVGDYINNKNWKSVDFEKPSALESVNSIITSMSGFIKDVLPAAKYAFYLKEVVSNNDEGKTSKIHYLTISRGKPAAPLGFEASFLSTSSIKLQWQPPDHPNGNIVAYQVYWRKSTYSFWKDKRELDWCKRDVKVELTSSYVTEEPLVKDECPINRTCSCEADADVIEAVKEDREAHSFLRNFEDRIIQIIFTKKTRKQKKSDTKQITLPPNKVKNVSNSKPFQKPSPISPREVQSPQGEVSGGMLEFVVDNLDYFQDYEFKVCACTEAGDGGGCARPRKSSAPVNLPCAIAQARTASHPIADNLNGTVTLNINGPFYNLSWAPPLKPNAIILKYEILIKYGDGKYQYTHCQPGHLAPYFARQIPPGKYTANVRAISPAGNGSWSEAVAFEVVETADSADKTVVIGVSIAAVLLCLVLVVVILYYSLFKRYFKKDVPGVLYASVNPEYMNSSGVYIPDEWELNREKIELIRELGQGSFGMVYEGIAHDIADVPELRVAVKTVNEKATIRERIEFLQEASIMKAFNSNHVVKLIGVVSQGQPTLVVMELMGRHDLKTFLRSSRAEENSNLLPPSIKELYQMAAEIADGMAYLAARKFVHRDLAARNCMVAMDFTVKIGDFGMARDIYETDYYRKGGKGLLPVRWMAPESLKDGVFKTASDVWSYGVVLWEICTLAAQPYQGRSNEEVLAFVLNGGLPPIPENCDPKMKEMMTMCWQHDPKNRPLFLEIIRLLENDVSADFFGCSFYHEMKKLAIEDTFCDDELHLILNRRSFDKTDRAASSIKSTYSSMHLSDSIDSNMESRSMLSKEGGNHTSKPSINSIKLNSMGSDYCMDTSPRRDNGPVYPLRGKPPQSADHHRERSLYDNYGALSDHMKYGDSPINHRAGNGEGDETAELKLSKIFFNRPTPV